MNDSEDNIHNHNITPSITPTAANTTMFNYNYNNADCNGLTDGSRLGSRVYKRAVNKNNECKDQSENGAAMHSNMDSMTEIRSCIDSVHFDDENMLKFKEDVFNKLNVPKCQAYKNNTLKLDMIDLRSCYNNILVRNKKMKKQKTQIERYIQGMDDTSAVSASLNLNKNISNASSDNSTQPKESSRVDTENNHIKQSINNAISNRKVLGQLDLNSKEFLND